MDDFIYAQLHIPKTAGYTFRYHVQKNLKEEQQLLLDYAPLGLDIYNPPLDYEIYKQYCWRYLSSLSKSRKRKIRVIHGHLVHYGVDEFFEKPIRYFTYIRNPIDRTLSVYKYLCFLYKHDGDKDDKVQYFRRTLLLNNNIPNFDVWLMKKYQSVSIKGHLSMYGHLKFNGYIDNSISKESIKKALDKFYFIGLSENFSKEILFFYDKLGMHKYFIDQNISEKNYDNSIKMVNKGEILKRNTLDNLIYEYGKTLNVRYKNENKYFLERIKRKSLERKIMLPLTQLVFASRQTMIRVSKRIFKRERLFAK